MTRQSIDSEDLFIGVLPLEFAADALWPQIEAQLQRTLPYSRGEYTLDDIRLGIRTGEMVAIAVVRYGIVEFVMICTLCIFPQKRVLYVIEGAGEHGADARDALLSAARSLKCDWIETRSRESVSRVLRRAGFETTHVVSILEVPK